MEATTTARMHIASRRIAGLDDRLIPVDALGRRWASWGRAARSTLHPLDAIRLMHDGAVLGGGPKGMPDDVRLWDECLESDHLASEHAALLIAWYSRGTSTPTRVIADRVGISRATIYRHWHKALEAMRESLNKRGLRI